VNVLSIQGTWELVERDVDEVVLKQSDVTLVMVEQDVDALDW
jgi:hypothetical protein